MHIHLQMLGPVRLMQPDVALPTQKTLLLLLLLHLENDWLPRLFLVDVLWPDSEPSQARASLRRALSTLRQMHPDLLICEHDRVRLHPQVKRTSDLDALQDLLKKPFEPQAGGALEAVQGPFLAHLKLDGLDELASLLDFHRNRVHGVLDALLEARAQEAFQEEDLEHAVRFIQARLKLSPLNEAAHHQWMQGLLQQGMVGEARGVYQTLQHLFHKELDAEPSFSWETLLKDHPPRPTPRRETRPLPPTQLPGTSFIGREQEREQVMERLGHSTCQLLTLHGPGGTGKTRFALHLLPLLSRQLGLPAVAVMLEHLSRPADVPVEIGRALGLQVMQDPLQDIAHHLHHHPHLLLLDNFEHLLNFRHDLHPLVSLLPQCKFLVTSRVRLNLPSEHLYPLSGLRVTSGQGDLPEAVQLLFERAQQVNPHFSSAESTLQDLSRLCEHLSGLPLALEMAGGLLRLMPPATLLEHLQAGEVMLDTSMVGVSARHQSMLTVIETSLDLLPSLTRDLLVKGSVFQGGFTLHAAREAMEASLADLREAIDASLLQSDPQGRFHLHPLVQQHLHSKLQARPDALQVVARHQQHFLRVLLDAQEGLLYQHTAGRTLDTLDGEWANLQQAWPPTPEDTTGVWVLTQYAELRGRYLEVARLLEGWSPTDPLLQAEVHGALAYLHMRTGNFERCLQVARQARFLLEAHRQTGHNWALWTLLQGLGATLYQQGKHVEAHECYLASLQTAQQDLTDASTPSLQRQSAFRVIIAQVGFCLVSIRAGRWEEMKRHLRDALSTPHIQQSPYLCYLHWLEGQRELHDGRPQQALGRLQAGLNLSREIEYHTLTAHIQQDLARTWMVLGDLPEAQTMLEEALTLTQKGNNKWAQFHVLSTLGDVHRDRGNLTEAMNHYRQCFVEAGRAGVVGFSTGAVLSACDLLEHQGLLNHAHALLGYLLGEETVPGELKPEVLRRFQHLTAQGAASTKGSQAWDTLAKWAYQIPEEGKPGRDLH